MSLNMPRGAFPTPRSELAAAEPFRPEAGAAAASFPSGAFPSPNYELAAAQSYRASGAAPESILAWPAGFGFEGNETEGDSSWAEEAFAKACAEPGVVIPADVVLMAARECGSSNFAAFMQTRGFRMDGKAYRDGPFFSVDWTNAAALHGAIARVGPVKMGVASASLGSGHGGQITPGASGWAVWGLAAGQPGDRCASLCGYGPLAALVKLFERRGVKVNLPSGMPAGLSYAMFAWGSIGIVDRQSLMNITGEAWVRTPTTIVEDLSGQ
jgi:hypothetical protein